MQRKESENILGTFFGQLYDGPIHDDYWHEHTIDESYNSDAVAHLGNSIRGERYRVFLVCIGLVLLVILGRFFAMQIVSGSNYAIASKGNRQRIIPIPSERGSIYDIRGKRLTENVPNFSVAIVPQDLPRSDEERTLVVHTLADLTEQSPEEIRAAIEKYGNYSFDSITILEDIDYESALKLQIEAVEMPGIRILRGSKRLYLSFAEGKDVPSSISHSLGYLSKLSPEELDDLYDDGYLPSDTIGKAGVERSYERSLRGLYGKQTIEVDVLGKEQGKISEVAPVPGKHLRLTIDVELQEVLERIMREEMEIAGKSKAAAVALDPRDGSIRALVSIPSYNNNDFSGGISSEAYSAYSSNPDNPLFNRAIGGTYPSGSTIKPAIAAAALEEGIITPNTSIISSGGINVGDWFFPDWQAGGHGITDVRRSIAWSVNTFYYYIGGGYQDFAGLGVEKITQYLRSIGFAARLGLDIPGEAEGFLPSREWKEERKNERWYIGDTYNLSIGQGDLLVTPLQIASMTAAFANGGTVYQPHVMDALIDPITKQEELFSAKQIREDIASDIHVDTIKQGMKDCVDYGSCRRLSLLPFTSGAKTGTAQWSTTKEPHAWFTSFAPYESPEIVLTVLVEEGEGGSLIGAPITKNFYDWWGSHR